MESSQDFFNVLVVCPENGMENVLLKIKKWFHENRSRHKLENKFKN